MEYITSLHLPYWYEFLTVIVFVFGTCIGSYLNVCIYRIPRELSTVGPRSFCPSCREKIPWFCNIPLLSYIFLRGKCRFCGTRISPRYILVETLVGLIFVLLWLKLTIQADNRPLGLVPVYDWKLIPVYWLIASGLILGTFVDFEFMIIPDRVTLGGVAAGLVASLLVPALHSQDHAVSSLLWSGVGAATGWILLRAVAVVGSMLFQKDAMGLGDVKLLAAIGAFLGFKGVLFSVVVSSLIGSVVGLALVLSRKKEMQSRIPYGPYLALAALIWILWGPVIVDAYMELITPPTATIR
jgi:leader peptidase (prepilin peptidase)/N-methyltransferase